MDIYTKDAINNKLTKKQDTLVSGTNIKTINGNSMLGSGNLTISGGGSGASVSSADYATANTQLNGLTIGGTNYKLLDVKANDGSSLIIGNNRKLASGASKAVAIGDCGSSVESGSNSTAIGRYSKASGDYSTAIGSNSKASYESSTAIGYLSEAIGRGSTVIGRGSVVYVPSWVSFDGLIDALVRTISLKSTDNVFFRNENIDTTKTTQASYASGKTLTKLLNEKQDTLVRIYINDIIDGNLTNCSLVFVGYYNLINTELEKQRLDLDTLSSNWQALMTGEYATTIWAGLCNFLSRGACFGCFYTVGGDIEQQETVSAIVKSDYLGYIVLNGTTPEGHIVFNSETALKTAFANSSMVLDD